MRLKNGLLALLFVSNFAFANELTAKVDEYFAAQMAVEHKDSKRSDVTHLLSLLTENATFEHPRFNAVQSKSEYDKGLQFYLGKYGKCDIHVQSVIEGLNVVVAEYTHVCIDQAGLADTENSQKQVTLFEFENSKIRLIRHYY